MRWTRILAAAAIGLSGCGGGGSAAVEPAEDVAVVELSSPVTDDVAVVDNTGTNLRSIVGTPTNLRFNHFSEQWNPARTRIAFIADLDAVGEFHLYVADPVTAVPLDLTPAAPPFQSMFEFRWSDDGALLAFVADATVSGRFDLYTVPVGGGAITLVNQGSAPPTAARNVTGFRWQPGTHRLAYVGDMDVNDEFDLYFVDADGSSHLAIGTSGGDIAQNGQDLEWAPVGNRVALRSTIANGSPSSYLFTVRDDGTGFVIASGEPAGKTVDAFRWQPGSSNQLAYTVGGTGATDAFELRRGNADTGVSSAVGPAGSPGDASEETFVYAGATAAIVYQLENATGQTSLRVSPSGTANVTLEDFSADPSMVGVKDFDVSPDGSRVAYGAQLDPVQRGDDLYVIGVDGTGRHQVNDPFAPVPDSGDVARHAWSPDSTRLAFSTVLPDESEDAYIALAPGGATVLVSTSTEAIDDLSWTSDSAFAMWSQKELSVGEHEIFLCTAAGAGTRVLTTATADEARNVFPR